MGKRVHGCGSILPGRRVAEYRTWANMLYRCRNPKSDKWEDYGGRGISVCARWFQFANFLADMGPRPSARHSLERCDNDGNYEPGNVVWATKKDQARNRRNSRTLEHSGETLTIAAWSERTGIPWSTLDNRIRRGWSAQKALETPIGAIGCWDTRKRGRRAA